MSEKFYRQNLVDRTFLKAVKPKYLLALFIGAGAVFLIPRILWIANSGSHLNDDDASIAFQPLIRIPIAHIPDRALLERLPVPDTTQWTRIRQVWGEPVFVISIIDKTGRNALCLPPSIRIDVSDHRGATIPLLRGGPPYGYSASCSDGSLRFHAIPGDTLNIGIATSGGSTVPAGDLIVVRDWWNTKDKLVGVYLNDDIERLTWWSLLVGVLFLIAGVVLMLRIKGRKHRTV